MYLRLVTAGARYEAATQDYSFKNIAYQICKMADFRPEYWHQLVDYNEERGGETDQLPLGEFAALQRLNLTHLANEIAKKKGHIRHHRTTSKVEMESLRNNIHNYTTAIQDYEYLRGLPHVWPWFAKRQQADLEEGFPDISIPYNDQEKNAPYDTSYFSLERKTKQKTDAIREFLRLYLPRRLSWSEEERSSRKSDYQEREVPEIYSLALDRIARFIIGMVGGCSLIVPITIMAFDSSTTKSLVTISVAVVMFALAFGLVFESDNRETLTATATYAAVLVVFLGASTSSPS